MPTAMATVYGRLLVDGNGGATVADGAVAGAGAAGAVGGVVCATAVSEMARALALSAVNSLFMSCPLGLLGRHTNACRRH